ncbi:MAG TPA: PAS domain S-box protein, partial [Opitutaceae bacterium]|nr:PAS domain S-box protein [Opitutaceae bacterium]
MQIDEPTHSSRVDHAASAVHLPPTSSWRNTDTAMSDGFKPPLNRHAVAFTGRLVPVIAVVASIDAIAHIVASVWPGRPTWSSLDRTSWVLWTAQLILGLSIGIGVRTQGRSAHRQRQIAAVLSGAVVLMLVLAAGFRPHWALKLNPAFIAVLGFAVLATLFRRAGGALVGQALALAITTFTLTGLCAALYGYHSLHDGTVLLGLAAAVFYLRPSEGLAAKFNAATAGGSVLRRLPLLVLLPQLIDWLALEGQRVGYYGEDAGVLFQATVTTFFVGALVWSMATALHEKHCAFLSAEDELRASEERYRKLVDMSPFAIVVKSERRIEFANPAAQRMAGAEHPRQLLMRSPFTFIHPDARREFESGVCQVLRDGIAMPRMEKRIVRLDGTELDVELSVSPVDYHGQRLAQVVARDVTIQKRALDALRASEERFRVAFEEAAVGMALISTEGLFLRVNGKLCEITGHTPADLCERSIDGMTHPDDVALGRPQRERLLAGEISSYQIEKRCIRADGNLVWIAATVSVVRRIGGEPDYLIAFVEDISERRNLEAQIRQSQKLEAIGQLAGGVAHDFNNMLTAIYGHVALLEEQPALTPAGLESLHEIAEAARRATSLTRQLLLFSRREVVQPRTMDLNAAVTGMGKMLRRLIGEQIQMHVELHPAPLEIYADPG